MAQIWLYGITLGLDGFILEAAANMPSKPHPSLQPGILQVIVIFQFAGILFGFFLNFQDLILLCFKKDT